MTLADVRRLFAYWRRYPPVRDLVAGFIGFKPESAAPDEIPQDIGALIAACPDGLMRL